MSTTAFTHEPRRVLTRKQRAILFANRNGRCDGCGRKLRSGEKWIADHRIALANGGTNSEDNFDVLCAGCDAIKTPTDLTRAAKSKRVAVNHTVPSEFRSTSRPMPGSRASGLSKRMNGRVERR